MTESDVVNLVACPACHAPAGAPCRTRGNRLAPCHRPRYELAKQYASERHRLEAWNRDVL